MKRSLCALPVLVLVASSSASGCASTREEPAIKFVEFEVGRTSMSCPERRVRSTEEPALAVLPPPGSFQPTTPWVEPEPFAGVVSDPQRLRLWRATVRDPAYLEWQQENAEPDAQMKARLASYRERQVFAVRGCGSTALYACGNMGQDTNQACVALADTASVSCRNGGTLRTAGSGDTMRFECSAPAGTPSPAAPLVASLSAVSFSKDVVARDLADGHLKEHLAKVEADLALAARRKEGGAKREACEAACRTSAEVCSAGAASSLDVRTCGQQLGACTLDCSASQASVDRVR